MTTDHRLSHKFFKLTKSNWYARHIAVFSSAHLIWLMLGVLVGISSWDKLNATFILDPDVAIFLLLLLPAWIVTMGISRLVKRERPYLEIKSKPLVTPFVHTDSFPSAHATIAFSILTLSAGFEGLLLFMAAAATLVALARVATGVHFFSDVIVGALIGTLVTKAAEIALLLLI
jgi:undecaprenyl-diphosphatase